MKKFTSNVDFPIIPLMPEMFTCFVESMNA
jgi:hypothetical protein